MTKYLISLLTQMKSLAATDLFLNQGRAPAFRINGRIHNSEGSPLAASHLEQIAKLIIPEHIFPQFEKELEISIGYTAPNNLGRFRTSAFRQQGYIGMVIRAIPDEIPSLDKLGIPHGMRDLAMLKRGLVLISGPAGSGKSTSLASLLNHRNKNDASHIITLEDPVEYVLPVSRSVVNQREVGVDCHNYQVALTNALRQSPDVMAIGEIRTQSTMESAIAFADTGHLCMATIHANSASQTFERIANFFPEARREQALLSLSLHIKAVLTQHLVPTVNGRLIAVFELLLSTPHIADLIRQGKFEALGDAIERGNTSGMQSTDQSLFSLFQHHVISAETALEYADSYRNMRLRMKLSMGGSVRLQ